MDGWEKIRKGQGLRSLGLGLGLRYGGMDGCRWVLRMMEWV